MKRSEKFRQANREAKATVVATWRRSSFFWWLAGFELADIDISFWHTPLVGLGRLCRNMAVCHFVTVILSEKVFKNFDLDDKEDNSNE